MHRNSSNHSKNRGSFFFLSFVWSDFNPLVTAGFVYAVYENEESVHKILHTCSTKTDRTLDDGRCEYYLDVYSQRTSSRRKSVRIMNWFFFLYY
jgi:hypothetical protein